MAKILLVTDAWHPQVNGVVTTLSNLVNQAKKAGDTIHVYHPGRCGVRFPLPIYPEIDIGLPNPLMVRKLLKKQLWDHIHIATPEAPVGMTFVRTCRRLKIPFSTSCHTKFPEFVKSRYPWVDLEFGWKMMQHVYAGSDIILTTTQSMVDELKSKGFKQEIVAWTRGVDREIFFPIARENKDEKWLVCVSRISHEKSLDDFCSLSIPNTKKILVGDGPYLETLKNRYPDVEFVGKKKGSDLAYYYQNADCFVFPSRADTFGVVIIEALACGTPVVGYNVTGPKDIIEEGVNGYLANDWNQLSENVEKSFDLDRERVYNNSLKWTWENCYTQFKEILLPAKKLQ